MLLNLAVHQEVGFFRQKEPFWECFDLCRAGVGRSPPRGKMWVGGCCQASQRGADCWCPSARSPNPHAVPRAGGTAVQGTPVGNPVVPKPPCLSPREGEEHQGHYTQHSSGHQFLPSLQMVSKLPLMKTICNLHLDKLEFFRLLHPETAMNFPPLYKEVFNSELQYSDPRES